MEELAYMTHQGDPDRVPGDWVKDVFAPIYDFDAIVAAGRDGHQEMESKIRRVPILDPLTVKEVFERVHSKVVAIEKEKQDKTKKEREEYEEQLIDPRKSCLWNTEELDILRKVYKSAQGEIKKLEISLREKCQLIDNLKVKVQGQEKEIDSISQELSEAKKANQRLVIHRNELLKQNQILDLKCVALKDAWIEIGTEKSKALEAEKSAILALDKERLLRHHLEMKLSEEKQNLMREKNLLESNLTSHFEMEMNDLKEVIQDLTVQLEKEKKGHEASKRGLDHLRHHFASLPLNQVLAPNSVQKDQIEKIDHCSL